MKITNIESVGKKQVYDLSISTDNYDKQQYILENGVISHNTGSYYSSDNIWVLGRRQEKEGTEVSGYNFIINVEKSRTVKEKSKIPISVSFDGGINKWSGLFDLAIAMGYLTKGIDEKTGKEKKGWFAEVNKETGEILSPSFRQNKIIDNTDFWTHILKDTNFAADIKTRYKLSTNDLLTSTENEDDPQDIQLELEQSSFTTQE